MSGLVFFFAFVRNDPKARRMTRSGGTGGCDGGDGNETRQVFCPRHVDAVLLRIRVTKAAGIAGVATGGGGSGSGGNNENL